LIEAMFSIRRPAGIIARLIALVVILTIFAGIACAIRQVAGAL
jgi:hypothetical protein